MCAFIEHVIALYMGASRWIILNPEHHTLWWTYPKIILRAYCVSNLVQLKSGVIHNPKVQVTMREVPFYTKKKDRPSLWSRQWRRRFELKWPEKKQTFLYGKCRNMPAPSQGLQSEPLTRTQRTPCRGSRGRRTWLIQFPLSQITYTPLVLSDGLLDVWIKSVLYSTSLWWGPNYERVTRKEGSFWLHPIFFLT